MSERYSEYGIVDLDNTISDWVTWVSKMVGGPVLNPSAESIEEMFGISDAEAQRITNIGEGYGSTGLSDIPDAATVLHKINDRYFLIYLSAAPRSFLDRRMLWMVERGFPLGARTEIYHLGSGKQKEEQIMGIYADAHFIVDDFPTYLYAAKNAGIPQRFLFTQPHNRYHIPEHAGDYVRVHSWSQIGRYLLG